MVQNPQKSKSQTSSSSKPSSRKKSPSKQKARHQIFKAFGCTIGIFCGVLLIEFILVSQLENTSAKTELSGEEAISNNQSESTQQTVKEEIDNIKNSQDKEECKSIPLFCFIKNSILLGQVQNFAVLVAAFLYVFDISDRKKQMERQAWQLIDGASGLETSGGRYQAIVDLYEEDKETLLKGFDANGADLIGINLEGAKLERVNLEGALLTYANFKEANLKKANLKNADLQGANLERAILWGANLEGANLQSLEKHQLEECEPNYENYSDEERQEKCMTNLQKADLGKAILRKATLNNANLQNINFRGADLSCADFRGTNVSDAKFEQANIAGAIFCDVENLTIEQISKAENYQKAKYDKDFCSKHQDKKLIKYEAPKLENVNYNRKEEIIPQILQQIQGLIKRIENKDLSLDDSEITKLINNLNNLADLIPQDESINSECKEKIAEIERGLRAEFNQVLENREKIYQQTKEPKSNADSFESELNNRPGMSPSKWLEDERNIILLRDKGISYFLDENKEYTESIDKQQLEKDIYKCLKIIDKVNFKDEEINFDFSFEIYSGIFQVIEKKVIPELENSNPDEFTNQMSKRLKSDCRRFIKNLQNKLDSVT